MSVIAAASLFFFATLCAASMVPAATAALEAMNAVAIVGDPAMIGFASTAPLSTARIVEWASTTVTPVTVTEVKSGTVVDTGGGSIIVQTEEGFKSLTQGDIDKRGVKIIRNGKAATISDFRRGDRLTATIVTSMPPRIAELNFDPAGPLTEQQPGSVSRERRVHAQESTSPGRSI